MDAHASDLLLAAVRTAHFMACIVLFGELAFVRFVAVSARPRVRVLAGSALTAVVSALAWLALAGSAMSGEMTIRAAVLARVVGDTQFGHAWLARMGLLVVAVVALRRAQALALLAATGVLCALAWMGHAGAAAGGAQRAGELAADAAHLLAAGAWLGTLPAFVAAAHAQGEQARITLTQRYSRLASVAVAIVLFTGVVNMRFRVGTLDALFHSDYGALLLMKIALVATMLALAAVNRWVLTPRLAAVDEAGARALRRNAIAEIALGALVVGLVGLLGITAPAMQPMAGMTH